MKQNRVLKRGSFLTLTRNQDVEGQEQLVTCSYPEHVDPHQSGREHHSVKPVNANCVDCLKDRQWRSSLVHEATISANLCNGATRLDSSNQIALCGLLEFNRERGLAVNAGALETLQRRRRQSQPPQREHLFPGQPSFDHLCHALNPWRVLIGQPRTARMSSFVQPAQHLYLRGSAMEIAKLSPLLSRPCRAQEGHRVK